MCRADTAEAPGWKKIWSNTTKRNCLAIQCLGSARDRFYTGTRESSFDAGKSGCPYCGEMNNLTESIVQQGEMLCEWECSECERKFVVHVHISITVTANKIADAKRERGES